MLRSAHTSSITSFSLLNICFCCFIVFIGMSMMSLLHVWTFSCNAPLFITSIASDVGRIFYKILLFVILLILMVVLILLRLLEYPLSVNNESLILNCSHLLFSCYESSFFLCALFPESAEGNQFPPATYSRWS